MSQVINISLNNILESVASTYSKFTNRYVVATFRLSSNAEMLMINQTPEANIIEFASDENIVIANPNDPISIANPMFNWPYFHFYNSSSLNPYGNRFWKIPVFGTSKHLGKFIYNTYTYYSVFGQFNGDGDIIQTTPIGSKVDFALNLLSGTSVYFYDLKIECLPSNEVGILPCDNVVSYYNNDGILEIPIP